MAIKRLSQSSSDSFCHIIYTSANDYPIGYCAIAFLDEEYDDNVIFSIDYVYINEIYRGNGYSRFISDEVVRLIDYRAKNKRTANLLDWSEAVTSEGERFSFMRTNELKWLGYVVKFK